MTEKLSAAKTYIERSTGTLPPETVGIVLGSGLGNFAERVAVTHAFDADAIPNYPTPSVAGHHGKLIFGTIEKKPVALVKGRVHLYEGRPVSEVIFYVHLLHALGVKTLVLTNAAGGINPNFDAGDLCRITDHINLMMTPLPAAAADAKQYHQPIYNSGLSRKLDAVALESKIELKHGVYAGVLGPSYETKAEIRMLATLRADLVGMSTVVEATTAAHLGMNVIGISLVTNKAAGLGDEKLSHDDVQAVANQAQHNFSTLLQNFIVSMD
jgi:purine-nucleoside phosphorylase